MTALMQVQKGKGERFYEFLFYAGLVIWLMSQYPSSAVQAARWLHLLLAGSLYAFLIVNRKLGRNPIAIGMGLLAAYTMATSFLSYYPTISFLKSASFLLLSGFLLVVPPTFQLLYPDVGAKEHMLRMYLYFAMVIVVSNTIWYFLMPGSSNEALSGTSFLVGRFRGWFRNPNDIAAIYGIFFLPILWFEMDRHKMEPAKLGLFFIFLLGVIQMFASQSRAGIASGIVSWLVLILGSRKWGSRTIIVATIALVVLATFVGSPEDNPIVRFIYRNETELHGSGRFPVWNATWNRFLDRPFLGSGLGVANTKANEGSLTVTTGAFSIEKGNSYLGALEELGLVGIAILIAAVLLPILKICWSGTLSVNQLTDKSQLVLIAIFAAGLVNVVFEDWFLSVGSFQGFSFWIFMSLLLYKGEKVENDQESRILAGVL